MLLLTANVHVHVHVHVHVCLRMIDKIAERNENGSWHPKKMCGKSSERYVVCLHTHLFLGSCFYHYFSFIGQRYTIVLEHIDVTCPLLLKLNISSQQPSNRVLT